MAKLTKKAKQYLLTNENIIPDEKLEMFKKLVNELPKLKGENEK